MNNIRWPFLGLVLYLAVLFCLERVGWGEPELAYSAWLNFWIALAGVAAVLMIPAISRVRPQVWIACTAVIYLVTRFGLHWFFPGAPVLGGIYTYITTVHFLLLVLAIGLAMRVSTRLNELNDVVQDITLGNAAHQAQIRDNAVSDIEREFVRSNRHNFPLTVIVVEPDPHSVDLNLNRSVQLIQHSMMARFILSRLVHITSQLVRRTDLIINQPSDENNFVVFSPDTTSDQAELLADRIVASIQKQTGIRVHCGSATYPNEGLNYEDLLRIAQDRLKPENAELATVFTTLVEGETR